MASWQCSPQTLEVDLRLQIFVALGASVKGPSVYIKHASPSTQVDVFDDKGDQLTQLSHELMTAIPPRVTVHQYLPVLAAGTGSGRMHIYRHLA